MSGVKAIKKRITSVRNTAKITRTMEMVATAKSKKLIDKLNNSKPYRIELMNFLAALQKEAGNTALSSPYLWPQKATQRHALFIITANRGLCGGYNSNVLRLAQDVMKNTAKQVSPAICT